MITSVIIMLLLSLFISLVLIYLSKRLSEKSESLFEEAREILPGVNCGGCGFTGCNEYARNVIKNPSLIGKCNPGGKEVADKLSKLLNQEIKELQKKFAVVKCRGGNNCKDKADYSGLDSCLAASKISGGQKACSFGCLGFGDCIEACKFGAIHMGKEGFPVVDYDKCTACGSCADACPRDIIKIAEINGKIKYVSVNCLSKDSARYVSLQCTNGCIGCGVCEKVCPREAIKVKENHAVIDYSLCIGCGSCVEKCPTGVISMIKN